MDTETESETENEIDIKVEKSSDSPKGSAIEINRSATCVFYTKSWHVAVNLLQSYANL
jgi:hypothetical protein